MRERERERESKHIIIHVTCNVQRLDKYIKIKDVLSSDYSTCTKYL